MPEWRFVAFADLASNDPGAFSIGPFGSRITKDNYLPSGVPVVRGVNLARGRFLDEGFVFVSEEKANELSSSILLPGDLVFTHRGTIGQVSMIPSTPRFPRYILSSSQVKARLNPSLGTPEFYYYWFRSPAGSRALLENSSTVGVPGIASPLATIRSILVPFPSRSEQRAIVGVLRALDDKIAVNDRVHRRCRELAITSGRQLIIGVTGDSVSMGDWVKAHKGVSYRSTDIGAGDFRLVTLKCVGRDGGFQEAGIKVYGGVHKDSHKLQSGDIVIAQTDLTQRAEVIGRPVRIPTYLNGQRLVASLDLMIVRPIPPLSREFLLALLSLPDFHEHAIGYCNGTTVLHMGARAIPEYQFRLPDEEVINRVTSVMEPLLVLADKAEQQNRRLRELRDALLPPLMSGSMRVREAEEAVAEAT
jgi:type I restriction enzyme, S subunit